jgi:hypothetical protein
MKKNYTIIFAQNNQNKDENYVLNLAEIEENQKIVEESLNNLLFKPRQKVVDEIMKFVREPKK